MAMTPKRYADGDRVECYVDADLKSGHGLGCWLEFRISHGSWIIESSIKHDTEEGESELVGLPTSYASNDIELVTELAGASARLIAATRSLDIAAL
jgi:hypothetical protein